MLAFFVDGTGTAALSGPDAAHATLTDNGTGDYTITFSEAFAQAPVAVATSLLDDQVVSLKAAPSTTAVSFETRTVAGTPAAADGEFYVIVYGSDATDSY